MAEPLIFYRGRFRRSVLWLVIVSGWLTVGALGLWCLGLVFEPGWSFEKVLNAVMVAGAGSGLCQTVLALQRWNRNFAKNRLVIDDAGVRGRLGARDVDAPWPEIRAVSHWRRAAHAYILSTRHGEIAFTAVDIPSPKRAARVIAARLGAPIQEVAAKP